MATIKYIKDVPLVTTVNLTDKLAASQGGTDANTISVGQIIDKHKGEVDPHAGKYASPLGVDDNYVTDAEKTKLANLSGVNSGDQDLSGYSLITHNHTGTYEPANSNIQSHISSTSNPHNVTAAQAGADPAGTAAGLVSTHASSNDHDGRYYTETETNSLLSGKQNTSEKGQALGYCPLDGSVKIAEAYLPDSVLGQVEYQGVWNATTNTPAIPAASSTNKGWYYIVAVSGTTTVDTISEWAVGDWIISNGATWNKVDNTDSVSSVFGRAGTIVANSGDYTAAQVTNVPQGNIAAVTVQAALNELDSEKAAITDSRFVTNGDSHDHSGGDGAQIAYSSLGSIPSTFTPASHTTSSHSDWPAAISMAEVGYLDGVTSAIQTQLNNKQPLDATLTALAGVTTAADKLIYATGSDTFTTATLTSTARTLLDDTTTGAMLTTLGAAADNAVVKLTGDQTVAGIKNLTSKTNLSGGALLPNTEALDLTANNRPSIRPSLLLNFANSKTLDPRITYTRASTATYYDGKTFAKAEENLFLNSATLVTQSVTCTAVAYTLSFYGTGTVTLSGASTAGPLAGTGATDRVVLTFTPTAGSVTFTVSGTVTNAQLEARSSVTAYTPTTTQPITNYIPQLMTAASGVPRFDHNPTTGESLGLLIEESRANLLTYSEDFSNAAWTKSNATVSSNVIVAPDGTLTGDKLIEDTANAVHRVYSITTSLAASTAHTYSVYAKAGERPRILVQVNSGANFTASPNTVFDLSNGTIVSSGNGLSTIEHIGNGWYRCTITATTIASSVVEKLWLSLDNGTATTYTGDGYSGIYIWGAQLEAGAFPTSYIKTEASAAARLADSASMTGTNFSSWYRQNQGTLYGEGENRNGIVATTNYHFAAISQGTPATQITLRIIGSLNKAQTYGSYLTAADQWALQSVEVKAKGTVSKMAVGYSLNTVGFSADGATALTDSTALISAATQLNIGSEYFNSQPINGTIRKLAFYPARLPNATLQAMTTP